MEKIGRLFKRKGVLSDVVDIRFVVRIFLRGIGNLVFVYIFIGIYIFIS